MSTGNPTASHRALTDLLEPVSVAVIGASDRPGNLGGRAVQLLRKFKFPGPIWPVNPKSTSVADLPCYASVRDLPGRPSVVVLNVAAASVARTIEECAQAGVHAGIAWAAGFAEVGGGGIALQQELIEVCRKTDFGLCGPNSIGIINSCQPMIGSFASSLVNADTLVRGNISMVSQSGGIGTAAFALAQQAGYGFRYLVSSGNEAVLSTADYLEAFAEDPATKVVAVYLEGVNDGAAFLTALEHLRCAGKPVVMLKTGTSPASARAAKAHTGALAGEDRVWQAIFREYGVITVESTRELLDVCLYLSNMDRAKLPRGNRVAIVGFGGGGGVLSADLCARRELDNPALTDITRKHLAPTVPSIASVANPLDLTPDMFGSEWLPKFPAALDTIAADPQIDMLFLPLSAMARGAADVSRNIAEFSARSPKPVFVAWQLAPAEGLRVLRDHGMHVFPEPASAIGVMGKLARHAAALQTARRAEVEPLAFRWAGHATVNGSGNAPHVISEDACHRLLAAAGLPVAPGWLATSDAEAMETAKGVGFPVALKGISAQVTHRAATGLLALDLRNGAEVEAAYRELSKCAAEKKIALDGIYVQHMIKGPLELLVSAFRDPIFGVMIVCGAGGNLAEIVDDVTLERAPFDAAHAAHVLERLRIVQRASKIDPAADVTAPANFVARLSQFAAIAPWKRFVLEVNPVKWHTGGVTAVDGLLVVEDPGEL